MNWRVKWQLNRISRKAEPDPAFVRQLEKRLKQEVGHPIWWVHWGKVGAAIMSASAVLMTGTGAYAYSSEEVVPDHPLYPVRQSIEQVEQTLAVTDEAKSRVELKQLARRVKEAQKLGELQRPLKAERLAQISEKITAAVKRVEERTDKRQEGLRRKAAQLERAHLELLVRSEAKAEAQEEKQKMQELIQQGRQTLKGYLQERRSQQRPLRGQNRPLPGALSPK